MLSTDVPDKLDVFGHDSDAFGVASAEVGILEKADEVGLTGLLEGHHRRVLKAKVGLEVLGDLANQALEGKLVVEDLRAFDLT